MKKAAQSVVDHEAFNMQQPEMVTRRKLIGGKWASVTTRKLAPGEKRRDPIAQLLDIVEEIHREEAEAAARKTVADKQAESREVA